MPVSRDVKAITHNGQLLQKPLIDAFWVGCAIPKQTAFLLIFKHIDVFVKERDKRQGIINVCLYVACRYWIEFL